MVIANIAATCERVDAAAALHERHGELHDVAKAAAASAAAWLLRRKIELRNVRLDCRRLDIRDDRLRRDVDRLITCRAAFGEGVDCPAARAREWEARILEEVLARV